MKRSIRFLVLLSCILWMTPPVLSSQALAADSAIDVSTASAGYFTVSYHQDAAVKMKVGVALEGSTVYYDYTPGTSSVYAFVDGDGHYTITLYRNTSGISYRRVEQVSVDVALDDPMAPYLVSTTEITFSSQDSVGRKAAELCAGLTEDADKVVAIHNYIASHFTYDNIFAAQVAASQVVNYTPDTARTLETRTGICYDFSALFAAMCRSQGIPCTIATGYLSDAYHAWDMVYVDGDWAAVDMTRSISSHNTASQTLAECVTSLDGYTLAAS